MGDTTPHPVIAQLRARRIALGVSQRELAKKTGIGNGHISQIEAGIVQPHLVTIDRMARALRAEFGLVTDTEVDNTP